METVEKQHSTKRRRPSSNNNKTTTPVDVKDLPQVFHDMPEVKEFNGFTNKERKSVHKETPASKDVKKKKTNASPTKHLHVKRSLNTVTYNFCVYMLLVCVHAR